MSQAAQREQAAFSLSVLTPTYNRARLLPNLYRSLLRQPNAEQIEWLVVDDGSTDDTSGVVATFVAENRLRIRYLRKENGGKHTALNAGVATITSLLTMIVDSDDELTEDALPLIAGYHEKYRTRRDLCGFSFLRIQRDGRPLYAGRLPADEFIESYIDGRINRHLDGDMAEVFYTECLREFPFPEYPGETFLSEDVVWIRMALKYKLVFINKPTYICEYLPGGLTKVGRTKAIRSPLGGMEHGRLLMVEQCCTRCRLKGATLYVCYGRFAGRSFFDLLRDGGHPLLCLVSYPAGVLLFLRWRRQYP